MDADAISDLFSGLGPVSIRRMFGGKGIYFDGVIIAVELRGELMLKGDATVAPDYEASGGRRWTYVHSRHGKTVAQIVFRFAQQIGMLPLTGTTNPDHMRQDLAIMDVTLSADELALIEAAG